ncbi:MAG: carboxypeptidase regulatory-like domain-containing protein [Planctomycetes bacterium]|nr:carboxypeptidase regulatory-like domain-containing protein [Planctomycetota bacterium]
MEPAPAVVRGRCVDPQGRALAGVKVDLIGRAGNPQRLEEHLREHGPVDWSNPPPIHTALDGRFEFRFVPPPPHEFQLWIHRDDRAPLVATWPRLSPGQHLDFGDVVLSPGVRVRGRVVDGTGAPAPRVVLILDAMHRPGPGAGALGRPGGGQTQSREDGSFEFLSLLEPGSWRVTVRGAQKRTPAGPVELVDPVTVLDVVVEGPERGRTASGVVVDDAGAPLQGADVRLDRWRNVAARTDGAGRFRLVAAATSGPDGPFALVVDHEDHEILTTPAVHEWGQEDLRLVLRRAVDLELLVRRASDGQAVEEFGARIFPAPGAALAPPRHAADLRGGLRHPGGRMQLRGIRRGTHLLSIEPARTTGLADLHLQEISVQDAGQRVVEVRLPHLAQREVRVQRADGTPAVGTRVALVQVPPGVTADADTEAIAIREWPWLGAGKVLRLAQATTDAAGRCVLHGPPGVDLAVSAQGATHRSSFVQPVRLEIGAPLTLEVLSGATLRGEIGPREVVADLLEQAGLPRTGPGPEPAPAHAPTVLLLRPPAPGAEGAPARVVHPGAPVDHEGRFTIQGIPPGRWDVAIRAPRGSPRGGSIGGQPRVVRSGVEFAEGGTVECRLALDAWRRGRLSAAVRLDGKPYQGMVQVRALRLATPGASEDDGDVQIRCGADGRFDTLLPGGVWQVSCSVRTAAGEGAEFLSVPAAEQVTVVAGQGVEATFHATTGTTRLRILDPDGVPVSGWTCGFWKDGALRWLQAPPTDRDGRTEVLGPAGTYEPRARRRALQDPAAWQAFVSECATKGISSDTGLIALPAIVIPGGGQEIVLRLPEAWRR